MELILQLINIVLVLLLYQVCAELKTSTYEKGDITLLQNSNGYWTPSTLGTSTRYTIQCAAECSRSDVCLGFVCNSIDVCYLQRSHCSQGSRIELHKHVNSVYYKKQLKQPVSQPCGFKTTNRTTKKTITTTTSTLTATRTTAITTTPKKQTTTTALTTTKTTSTTTTPSKPTTTKALTTMTSKTLNALTCEYTGSRCKDLFHKGCSEKEKLYTGFLTLPNSKPRLAGCFFTNENDAKTIVARNTGKNLFSRHSSEDYDNGFNKSASAGDDFWLGLDFLHHYTLSSRWPNSNMQKLQMVVRKGTENVVYTYEAVQVQSLKGKATGRLESIHCTGTSWSSYSKNNCETSKTGPDGCFFLNDYTPTDFSVPDADNHITVKGAECPQNMKSGWWFTECNDNPVCNPLGQFYGPGDTVNSYHIQMPQLTSGDLAGIDEIVIMLVEPLG